MIRSCALAVVALMIAGCPSNKPATVGSAELASQARTQLAERERKITSYRFHGSTTDLASNQTLGYRFSYRSPAKMRGETEGAQPHVIVFDGQNLRDLDVNAKKLTTFVLTDVPKDRADAFLHQVFAPFAPEGFRAPLLPGKDLAAEARVGESDQPQVKLSATVADGATQYAFTFVFSTPAMDLLDKQIHGPDGDSRVQVAKQTCVHELGLCFPSDIVESHGGQPSARTVLSDVVVNGPVTDAEFALSVPAGGTEERKTLAAAP